MKFMALCAGLVACAFVFLSCSEDLPFPNNTNIADVDMILSRDLWDPESFTYIEWRIVSYTDAGVPIWGLFEHSYTSSEQMRNFMLAQDYIPEACSNVGFYFNMGNRIVDEPLIIDNNTIYAEILVQYLSDPNRAVLIEDTLIITETNIPIGQRVNIGYLEWDQTDGGFPFAQLFFDENPDSTRLDLKVTLVNVFVKEVSGYTDFLAEMIPTEFNMRIFRYTPQDYLLVSGAIGFTCELFVPQDPGELYPIDPGNGTPLNPGGFVVSETPAGSSHPLTHPWKSK